MFTTCNPYIYRQVLGLSPGANSEAVQRSYRRALNDAKRANDKGRVENIEAAHTSIMMSGLTARMKVGANRCLTVGRTMHAACSP